MKERIGKICALVVMSMLIGTSLFVAIPIKAEEDTTPPTLFVPDDIIKAGVYNRDYNEWAIRVYFDVYAIDDIDSWPLVTTSVQSGDLFFLGTTTVECTATDYSGNIATDSFNVTVVIDDTPPVILTENVTAQAESIESNEFTKLTSGHSNIIELLNVNEELYISGNFLSRGVELFKMDVHDTLGLVADINFGSAGSNPQELTYVRDVIYFSANDGINGNELWKTDGTQEGTIMVKDINSAGSSNPWELVNVNGILFFTADDGINGRELWRSDGTQEGTFMVKDIRSSGSSDLDQLYEMNGILYFRANDGPDIAFDLWRSDGTDLGTYKIKEKVSPTFLTEVNNVLYFRGGSDIYGLELWRSDGSLEGTFVVKDINPTGNSGPLHLTNVNDILYFCANDGTNGYELWRSDGSSEGTFMVKDINPSYSSYPHGIGHVNNIIYFSADDGTHGRELWRSDGTSEGTTIVKDINPSGNSDPEKMININGKCYFVAYDLTHGRVLWRTNGTETGTVIVNDLNPMGPSDSLKFIIMNGYLYFVGSDGLESGLWKHQFIGAVVTYEISVTDDYDPDPYFYSSPPSGSAFPVGTTTVECLALDHRGNQAYTTFTITVVNYVPNGKDITLEPLVIETDEKPIKIEFEEVETAGTIHLLIDNIGPTEPSGYTIGDPPVYYDITTSSLYSGNIIVQINYSDVNYTGFEELLRVLHYEDTDNDEVPDTWVDVTLEGYPDIDNNIICVAVSSLSTFSVMGLIDDVPPTIFVPENIIANADIYPETSIVKDIDDFNSSYPGYFTIANNMMFFEANGGEDVGIELWASDGTQEGTHMVKDINPGYRHSLPKYLTEMNDVLYFQATDVNGDKELWRSDGSSDGTYMLKNINPSTSSAPYLFYNAGNLLYFSADDGAYGRELWRTDGTPEGTFVIDIVQGWGSSNPVLFIAMDDIVYFRAQDKWGDRELWRSDGTQSGTYLVKDINPTYPNHDSNPGGFKVMNRILYFHADDGSNGRELWRTDGTESGTYMVKDINPMGSSLPNIEIEMNGIIYFTADDGINGREFWRSDGTSYGTSMLKDINPTGSSSPTNFIEMNGVIYFSAEDGINGRELWRSDGTESGTYMVKDINSIGSSSPYRVTVINGNLYFTASDSTNDNELWRSDGTDSGTYMIKDINPTGSSSISAISVMNGIMYLTADDGTNGKELWRSDGTSIGTYMVRDINPTGSSSITNLIILNGILYFSADDGINGEELWISDGSEAGTNMLEIFTGTGDSNPEQLTDVNGQLFFTNGDQGSEVWVSTGTQEGTYEVKDIIPGSSGSFPSSLTNVNGILYFSAFNELYERELWASDGTEEGTYEIEIVNGWEPQYLTEANGILYFFAYDDEISYLRKLYRSDGTSEGTYLVKDISGYDLKNVNGMLYFVGSEELYGNELWKSDGTEAGTVMVKDIRWGHYNSNPQEITNILDDLYFAATGFSNDRELWKSNGTSEGTYQVKDINPSGSSNPQHLINYNDILYFSADDGVNGQELWKSDGTEAGTVMVKDINPSGHSNINELTVMDDQLYLTADDGTGDIELWRSDGTSGGTYRVIDINPTGSSNPYELIYVNGWLYFIADDGTGDIELWRSDGTSIGTSKVDINPDGPSNPEYLTNVNKILYFVADDGVHGIELWKIAPAGAVVNFQVSASDEWDESPYLAVSPPSRSFFPQGTTTVICTARDFSNNTGTSTFSITTTGYVTGGNDFVYQPIDLTTGETPATLTFDHIEDGFISLTTSEIGPEAPSGFQVGDPPSYFDITTTATYSGSIDVCIDYSGFTFTVPEEYLKLLHFEDTDNDEIPDTWIDVTSAGYPDTVNNIICGTVSSLSIFAVMGSELPIPGYLGDVTIDAFGNVIPQEAPIAISGQAYTLTHNIIGSITIHKSGITLNGDGYTLLSLGGGNGIYISGLSGLTIKNFNINEFSYGIYLVSTSGCSIIGNTVLNNEKGIALSVSVDNTLRGNKISENYWGLYMFSSNNNIIMQNKITLNLVYGIWMHSCNDNAFYFNHFHNNNQFYRYSSSNIWDNGNGYGNFWNDYTGLDNGSDGRIAGDGVGDTNLPHKGVDNYPLMASSGNVYNINKDRYYVMIQSAVEDADLGDTIEVETGTYYENVVIDRSITLRGENRENTLLKRIEGYYGIELTSVTGVIIENMKFEGFYRGIHLVYSDGNTMRNINFLNSIGGMDLLYSDNNAIFGNNISEVSSGIEISYSYNNNINGNKFFDIKSYAISLSYSHDNIIEENIVSTGSYGITNTFSYRNTIRNNIFSEISQNGIDLYNGRYNILSNNSMTDCGIYIFGDYISNWNTHTIDTLNTVNSKPVYYWKNVNFGTVPPNAGQIIIAGCTNIVIENQDINGGYVGVLIGHSSNIYMGTNIFTNLTCGIFLAKSNNNEIVNNLVSYCKNAVVLFESDNNNLIGNNIFKNNNGVTLQSLSEGNHINYNIISDSAYGIYLYAAAQDNVLKGNTISNIQIGISLSNSNSNQINDNNISKTEYGINFIGSVNGNTVSGNTISCNSFGLYLYYSDGNIISGNEVLSSNIKGNIFLYCSRTNTLINNFMTTGGGIYLAGNLLDHWNTHNIDTSNILNGRPVYYWKDVVGGTVPVGAGQVILANCTNVVVENQDISDVYIGINFGFSSDNMIQNNNILNSYHGVYLYQSNNNILNENTITDSTRGFQLEKSYYNIIGWNSISGGEIGIYLIDSYESTINDNIISGATIGGISLSSSNSNTVSHNSISVPSSGIFLFGSYNIVNDNIISVGINRFGIYLASPSNVMTGNAMTQGGIDFSSTALIYYWNTHTIDSTNTVNGKPVYYWKDMVGGTVPGGAGQVILANCMDVIIENQDTSCILVGFSSSITIRNNIVSGLSKGIYIFNSNGNIIRENELSDNGGISLLYSNSNTISGNTIFDRGGISLSRSNGNSIKGNNVYNAYSITLGYSQSNLITHNTLSFNSAGFGLSQSNDNTFYYNNLIENMQQIYLISSPLNTWDNGEGEGNYWSDYEGIDDGSNGRPGGDGVGDTNIPHPLTDEGTGYYRLDSYPMIRPLNIVHNTDKDTYYIKIQTAIDDADLHDTIKVRAGTYYENLVINKPLSLIGESRNTTIIRKEIQLNGVGGVIIKNMHVVDCIEVLDSTGITITESSTYIMNLENSNNNTISGNYVTGDYNSGIRLYSCIGNTISSNTVIGEGYGEYPWWIGIHLVNSDFNSIDENTVKGIGFKEKGMQLEYSNENVITGNNILENEYGIKLYESFSNVIADNTFSNSGTNIWVDPSNNNIISNNTILNGEYGILIDGSADNTIINNIIFENIHGIQLDETCSNNNIYLNHFIENEVQAIDNGSNTWDNGNGTGNFWSDYTGEDTDGDGIGDTSYGVLDDFPIIEPQENLPPVADAGGPYLDFENSEINFDASNSIEYNDGDGMFYRWDLDNDGIWDTGYSSNPTTTHTWNEDYVGTIMVEVFDGEYTDTATSSVIVNNANPVVDDIIGPVDPVQLGYEVQITCTFSDAGPTDTHVVVIDWDDGQTTTIDVEFGVFTVSALHIYTKTGVYTVKITVTDDDGGSGYSELKYVVVYDPTAGFVTGAGWIFSPEGAFPEDPSLSGKATFGFVAKYKKGKSIPVGNTEFQFHAADLNFHSDDYEWLVIAGSKAMFKGNGTINGQGTYKFILTAVDGDLKGGGGVDKLRMKIWIEDEITGEETIIYDNMLGAEDDEELGETTELGGGSIVIHKS